MKCWLRWQKHSAGRQFSAQASLQSAFRARGSCAEMAARPCLVVVFFFVVVVSEPFSVGAFSSFSGFTPAC